MPIELTIIIKDSEKTLKKKFLSYNTVTLDPSDPYVKELLQSVLSQFVGEPEDIILKASMVCK